ncbi:LemA family protein [Psychrobacter sp. AOP22-C1-22]|uniref:LemA family protein n=1 Tax=unclassified Psychrobacter TaxID=196806 RepID=UPI0017885B79|nr:MULTISPECIES: LemA family protein [unclassified Psychrobacter]MBE0406207.1 LemA family protein [Psychrobacter sp. FME6]MBE0444448.1 LemA family protein [Psychrobacter sp. FME5]MDN5802599.1 LemA family protein [Psychrobacter sp.]
MWLIIIVAIVVAILIWVAKTYNRLQTDMQSIREQLSNLQAALKKRVDLANQVIDIAQGYGEHEKLAHLAVSKGNQAMDSMKALSQAFPDLKANQTYQTLMGQLENLEETILQRRERYNASVRNYNSYRNSVPTIFIAQKLSFSIAPYYELEDPDFMEKIKLFERDDSEALQQLIENSGKSVSNTIQSSKTKLQEQLVDIQNSKQDNKSVAANAVNNEGLQGQDDNSQSSKTDAATIEKPDEESIK